MDFKRAWLAVWGVMYIMCVFPTSNLIKHAPPIAENLLFSMLGFGIILSLVAVEMGNKARPAGAIALLALSIVQAYGCVEGFTGGIVWNVPFESQSVFQVSMSFMDFVSAVLLVQVGAEGLRDVGFPCT